MLENIKSSFFIKIIFSFLDEKTKLKLVKYNKCLQNNKYKSYKLQIN